MKVHNLETFSTKYGYPSFEEDDIEGVGGQEKVAVYSEPFRFGRTKTKTRPKASWCFHSFIDFVSNRFEDTEDTVQLITKNINHNSFVMGVCIPIFSSYRWWEFGLAKFQHWRSERLLCRWAFEELEMYVLHEATMVQGLRCGMQIEPVW